jgi:DNA-binding NarL/FixJ family response regulator
VNQLRIGEIVLQVENAERRVHRRRAVARGSPRPAFIAEGKSNREIAAHFLATEDAIKNHVSSILSKLDANDRTHAVMIALKRGIIPL